ncbi:MAG: ribosome maturation factor RimP, partial [Chitinophagales bacterium]
DIRHNPSAEKFEVFIDTDSGVTINQCEQVSRYLQFLMENDAAFSDGFALDVSSPGMENPFKVERQYLKNIGKTVEVLLQNGAKKEGVLTAFEADKLFLQMIIPPKKKGMQPEFSNEVIHLSEIKSTKKKIAF